MIEIGNNSDDDTERMCKSGDEEGNGEDYFGNGRCWRPRWRWPQEARACRAMYNRVSGAEVTAAWNRQGREPLLGRREVHSHETLSHV